MNLFLFSICFFSLSSYNKDEMIMRIEEIFKIFGSGRLFSFSFFGIVLFLSMQGNYPFFEAGEIPDPGSYRFERSVEVVELTDDELIARKDGVEYRLELTDGFKAVLRSISERDEYIQKRIKEAGVECADIQFEEIERLIIREAQPEEVLGQIADIRITYDEKRSFLVYYLTVKK